MKQTLTMLLPVFLSLALSASARAAGNGAGSASVMHGRRLFKFQSKADFAGFRLSGARWDGRASGIVFQPDGARTDAGNSVHYGMLEAARAAGNGAGSASAESSDIETGFPANQMVLSWNADTPAGSYLKVYIQVRSGGFWSRRFAYAIWNRDNRPVQRMTVNGQSDDIAAMETDILISKVPVDAFRVLIELCSLDGKTYPTLRLLTAHCMNTQAADPPLRARKSVWGTDLPIPERSQLTIPQGNRFCSATSTSMVLEYWGKELNRPELNVPLRTAVDGIYDYEMGGTGNWPFNTAYAAEFGGLRAYVTRFANMSQIEDWIAKGVPVIVSMDYNILMHSEKTRRMGHLMVFRGFTDKGDCIINDPYTRLDEGEHVRKIFNRKDFEASWLKEKGSRGTVYLIFPNSWAIPKDRYGNW